MLEEKGDKYDKRNEGFKSNEPANNKETGTGMVNGTNKFSKSIMSFFQTKYSCHSDYLDVIKRNAESSDVLIIGVSWCPWTIKAKELLKKVNDSQDGKEVRILLPDLVNNNYKVELLKCLNYEYGTSTTPQIYIKGKHIGNYGHLIEYLLTN